MATRLGVVSYLNSKPLIAGLDEHPDVEILYDVPAALPARLQRGDVDVALVPIIDVIRSDGGLNVVSDGCIACDGETMTVRVYSQRPPHQIRTLYVDGESHTSVALATVLWHELFDTRIELRPLDARVQTLSECESVLLIGDKVVRRGRHAGFAYEVDLGGAWRQHTGLGFVFAVWAQRADRQTGTDSESIAEILRTARDRGVANAHEIAESIGPQHWWPADLAVRYLTKCLKYELSERTFGGANLFAELCGRHGLAPSGAQIRWPRSMALAGSAS